MNTRIYKSFGTARWLFALALVLCALGTQARAQNDNAGAQGTPPAPAQTEQQPQPDGPVIGLMQALNLTPEQRAQLAAIAQQHNVELAVARQRLQFARRALNQAIYTDNPDQNVVNERTRDVAAAQEALIRLNAQTEFKVRQVLTPEQLKMFRAIRQQQRRMQRLQGQPDGNQRRPPRERFPGANRQPNAPPRDVNNANAPLTPRERQQRRQPRP